MQMLREIRIYLVKRCVHAPLYILHNNHTLSFLPQDRSLSLSGMVSLLASAIPEGQYLPGLFWTLFHAHTVGLHPSLHFRPLGALMPNYPAIWNASKRFSYARPSKAEPRAPLGAIYITGYYFIYFRSVWCQEGLPSAFAVRRKGIRNVGGGRERACNKKTRRVFEFALVNSRSFSRTLLSGPSYNICDWIIDFAKCSSSLWSLTVKNKCYPVQLPL